MPEASRPFSISVIIPTYNRERVLAKAIEGYLRQSSPELIQELIVIDDGSTDNTEAMVREFSQRSPFPIRYFRQSNKGPSAARNVGIREAHAPLVLFSDSDIIPERDLVKQHLEWHKSYPEVPTAVLGYVTWASEIHATPFMRWYGECMIFGFEKLRNVREVTYNFFYTCNVSLKVEFLRTCGQFDEDFKSAAFEDIDLGYRLSKKGLRLIYNAAAIGYHFQFFSFEDACRKRFGNTAATRLFFEKDSGQTALNEMQVKWSRSGYIIGAKIASTLVKLLRPAQPLLNSHLALPRIIYHLFYWDCTRRFTQDDIAAAKAHDLAHRVAS